MGDNVWQEVFQNIFRKNSRLCAEDVDAEQMNAQFDIHGGFGVCKAGEVNIVSGRVEIGDPLCYLNTKYSCTLEKKIPPGRYPVYLSVISHPVFGERFLSAKLDVTGRKPVRYEIAMPQGYSVEDRDKPGVFAMFGVDTGMACFCDKETSLAYDAFLKEWQREHPEGNYYNDYFAPVMKAYALEHPQYQREDGDYIEWRLTEEPTPGVREQETQRNLVMFTSGFGDGVYSGYWGIDSQGDIACLVIRFIDPRAYDVPMPKLPVTKKFYKKKEEIKPLVKDPGFGVATDRIMVDGCRVGYLMRVEPNEKHPEDSGWRFYEGSEDKAYMTDAGHLGVYALNTIANYDPDIIPLLDAPVGMAFFRGSDGEFYVDGGN